jgi:UDP-N-acetylmuramoyl-tripeptide--D-alanyl-D-alanine ligase
VRAPSVLQSLGAYGPSVRAFVWRRLMVRTTFVAVTGSYGKTTATECLGTILAAHRPTNWVPGGANSRRALAAVVLRTRPRHRFTLIEVGTKLPGALRRASWMIDPDLAIVLAVGRVHSNSFADLDAVAAEKAQLLRRIRGSRVAVLNGDDPWVSAMAGKCRGKVMTFGRSPGNDLWADEVRARWPSRLSFRARSKTGSCLVRTNFVGEHWLSSVLGALLAARACGVALEEAAAALEGVHPPTGRMQPVSLPNGVTFLRDEFSESASTMDAALSVLESADAGRRVLVLGDVHDGPAEERQRLEDLGRRAARAADVAVFLGRAMRHAARAAVQAGMMADGAHVFRDQAAAAEFLRAELRAGDLVLLRGSSQRHLERLYFSQLGTIRCALRRCALYKPCDRCEHLGLETGPGDSPGHEQP